MKCSGQLWFSVVKSCFVSKYLACQITKKGARFRQVDYHILRAMGSYYSSKLVQAHKVS